MAVEESQLCFPSFSVSDVDDQVQKRIEIFYGCLEKHVDNCKTLCDEGKSCMSAIFNQGEQLRNVLKFKVDHSEFEQFPGIKENLEYQIKFATENELAQVYSILSRFNTQNRDLKSKLTNAEVLTFDLDWEHEENELIRGTATQPPLATLLRMGYECCCYYKNMYYDVFNALENFNPLDEKSCSKFLNFFQFDDDVQQRINYVLAITRYINRPIDI